METINKKYYYLVLEHSSIYIPVQTKERSIIPYTGDWKTETAYTTDHPLEYLDWVINTRMSITKEEAEIKTSGRLLFWKEIPKEIYDKYGKTEFV